MRIGMKRLCGVALAAAIALPSAASGQPKQPFAATLRILEVAGSAEAHATVDHFDVSKRMAWRSGAGEEAVYQGTQESILRMKLRAEGAQAGAELVGTLMRASEEDAQLGRPPMLSVAIPSMTFRGVLESIATRCDPKACEADITVIQAQRALARGDAKAQYDDPARSPGF